jgi:hypothetical protein
MQGLSVLKQVVHIATTVLLKGYYGIYRNERQILALKET